MEKGCQNLSVPCTYIVCVCKHIFIYFGSGFGSTRAKKLTLENVITNDQANNKQSEAPFKSNNPTLTECTPQSGISASLFSMPYLVEPRVIHIHTKRPPCLVSIVSPHAWARLTSAYMPIRR